MYMCRETIRRAVVQKFKEAKGSEIESFDQLYNEIRDVKEANDIINSIKICDPAVGSGHFLVSALNEVIAIKSELGVLTDRGGNVLRDYAVEVVNDELIVSINHLELFEYRPGNKESQRVQEALFHEKQTIIENCLFGVDINANSVKICRLRLWIELLKNAYYTAESKYTELETLPNIDINIKQGNSLVSRFPLDADLSKALKSIKYNIDDYRGFVNDYKNATDKEEKRGFEVLISQIKSDFRTEIGKNDPKVLRKNKLAGELYNLLNQAKVFEPSERERKALERKKEKIEIEINKLAADINEVKSSAVFKNSFEWRFEFPEVLDRLGNFLGFDVIIGNPPYGVKAKLAEKSYFKRGYRSIVGKYDSYGFFIELATTILSQHGQLGFIVPHTWLTVTEAESLRKYLLESMMFVEIDQLPSKVFDDATVETVNIFLQKNRSISSNRVKILLFDFDRKVSSMADFNEHLTISINTWKKNEVFNLRIGDEDAAILEKLASNSSRLKEICDLSVGVQAYDSYSGQGKDLIANRVYHATFAKDQSFVKELNGKDIKRFGYEWPGNNWISYGDWLAHPRSKRFFDRERILVREITLSGKYMIAACIAEEFMVNYKSILNIIRKEESGVSVNISYLLAVINSSLMSWRFSLLSNKLVTNTFPRISIFDLKEFPIRVPDLTEQQPVIDIVKTIADRKRVNPWDNTDVLERKIDELIFRIYGLSEEEISIVDGEA